MREDAVEMRLVRECKARGWLCVKFVSPGRRDMPDRIIFRPRKGRKRARVHLVECKRPSQKPRASQRRKFDELGTMGFKVHIVDSYGAVDELMGELENE